VAVLPVPVDATAASLQTIVWLRLRAALVSTNKQTRKSAAVPSWAFCGAILKAVVTRYSIMIVRCVVLGLCFRVKGDFSMVAGRVRLVVIGGLLFLAASRTIAAEDLGLLLVAHGSPSPDWNRPVIELAQRVERQVGQKHGYRAVKVAMLESAKPDIAASLRELEEAGCRRIVAIPLFISHSSHTLFDVPTALGVLWSPRLVQQLDSEGIAVARPRLPVVMTTPLSDGNLLEDYLLREVERLSKSPSDEALVLLAHGDEDHQPLLTRRFQQLLDKVGDKTGIEHRSLAFVAVGQQYADKGLPAIEKALEARRRGLVVATYLNLTAEQLHRRWVAQAARAARKDPLANRNVVFSDRPLIAEAALLEWIDEMASGAARHFGSK
jgi:hypothetical protein